VTGVSFLRAAYALTLPLLRNGDGSLSLRERCSAGRLPSLLSRRERKGPAPKAWEGEGLRGWRLLALLLTALFFAPPALADVVSPRAEAVAVTIYRDRAMTTQQLAELDEGDTHGLALVSETRTIDVPAGRSRVKFEGVADGIIPESATVSGLPGSLVERNFDFDLLGPGSILQRFVGQSVRVVRTNPRTGRATNETATLRSGPDGVVLDFNGRIEALRCSGAPEKLVFDHAPDDLADRPTLSVIVNAPAPGRYTVHVTYLTVRLDWAADYIARISPDGTTLALTGWITLANRSGMSFVDAPTAVVAGRLERVEVELPEISTPQLNLQCWPMGTTHGGWYRQSVPAPPPPPPAPMALGGYMDKAATTVSEMVVVTAQRRAVESQLGDYKQYTLAEPTTVAARQTKQVMFLTQPAVKFETLYRHTVDDNGTPEADDEWETSAAQIILRFDNKLAQGLGRGLPAGNVQLRLTQAATGREQFAGEYPLERDVPVGEPFELFPGDASDIQVGHRVTDVHTSVRGHLTHYRIKFEVHVTSAKAVPATVEIRHTRGGNPGFRITAESAPHGLKAGDPLWRLSMPSGADRTLTYTVEYDETDD
jgi:hypothetical protein